ncbi:unnamed protein product, partial [Meganyctiphanes norvegica]
FRMASNIFNQKHTDVEDTIHYWLFPFGPDGFPVIEVEELEELLAKYQAHIALYCHEYIWNKEPFTLKVKSEAPCDGTTGPLGPHLSGVTVVGDYIEDEWFIVFLLMKLTEDFPGLVVRVVDNDGEFLLIEAAKYLPSWVNPETAEQRVYLHQGSVHLIPLARSPGTLTPLPAGIPHIMDAVNTVHALPKTTQSSTEVNSQVKIKINGYPGKISRSQHIGHAYVPVTVAALLREYPTLVAASVHAFCTRELQDNKALRIMRHFPPETRVLTAVRFSKALYAQMAAHTYTPDQRTGWDLPKPTQEAFKSHLLGLKLACGFELLVCRAGGVTPGSTPSSEEHNGDINTHLDLSSNPKWLKYKQSLTDKGYFRGELEGSKLYVELQTRAQQYFVSNLQNSEGSEDDDMLSTGAMVLKLMTKVNVDHEFYKERATRLVPEDDDSWLKITPDALEQLLSEHGGDSESAAPKTATDDQVMNSLSAFLGHMADLEGAEVPKDLQERMHKLSTLSSRKSSSSRKNSSNQRKSSGLSPHPQIRKISNQSTGSDSSQMSSLSNKVDFAAESFTDALNNILDMGDLCEDQYWVQSDDEESSGMSSYGEEDDRLSLSRKSSNSSQKSDESGVCGPTSGTDPQIKAYMKEMERELQATTIADNLASQDSDADDEFDDVEDFKPVKVDMKAVQDLVKSYSAQNGTPGPASSLLNSMGIKPKN